MKLRIITGRAGAGKSKLVLETIAAQRFERPQILLVPEHATHEAELDLCRALGDTASRDGEVLSFQSLSTRVLSQTGGISEITLDNGGKILIMRRALQEVSSYLTVFSKPSQRPAFLRELVALAYVFRINSRPGGGSYKLGWTLLILTVPVVGLILYWLWNGDHPQKRLDLQKLPRPRESDARQEHSRLQVEHLRREHPEWGRLAAYLDRQGFPLYTGTGAVYLPTGEAYLEDLLERMEQAEHFIFMEFYIMAEGQLWDRLMDIFRRKAGQGVEIKVLFDDFGSMMRMSEEAVEELRRIGAEVLIFNPVHHYDNRLYFNYRDHRKIACIDGDTAYTGGANIADEYANLMERFGYWKDDGIRLEGQGAWTLTREFIYMWERMGGAMHQEHDYYRPHGDAPGQGFVQPFVDGPDSNPVSSAEDAFLQLIGGAKHMVYITSPYLAIDESMEKALCMAAGSGVDVRLMMPGIPDHKFAFMVAESYFGELLDHGVKIYRFTPGLLHGKTVLADREAAFVGSVNMDYRSFQLHFECGTLLYGAPALETLLEDMDGIMEKSRQVTRSDWEHRPLLHRVLGGLLRPFAMWM